MTLGSDRRPRALDGATPGSIAKEPQMPDVAGYDRTRTCDAVPSLPILNVPDPARVAAVGHHRVGAWAAFRREIRSSQELPALKRSSRGRTASFRNGGNGVLAPAWPTCPTPFDNSVPSARRAALGRPTIPGPNVVQGQRSLGGPIPQGTTSRISAAAPERGDGAGVPNRRQGHRAAPRLPTSAAPAAPLRAPLPSPCPRSPIHADGDGGRAPLCERRLP